MKITICDICRKQHNLEMVEMIMYRFEAGKTWIGTPKFSKEICHECMEKIFLSKS